MSQVWLQNFSRIPAKTALIFCGCVWISASLLHLENTVALAAQQSESYAPGSLSNAATIPLNPARPKTRGVRAVFPPNGKADISLGGLFPVHKKINTALGQTCGELNQERGIQRLEAMLYAVKEVNKNETLLPNVTLGALVHDTCSQDTIGLEESLEFVMESFSRQNHPIKCDGVGEGTLNASQLVAGVVGAASSTVSIQVANLLRLFRMPQISYASTSPDLSNKHRYDYFVRTVPSDTHQARVILDVIAALNWTAVFTVNSRGNYGERGMEEFLSLAKAANICVVSSAVIELNYGPEELENIIKEFMNEKGTRGVVLFCTDPDIHNLLEACKRRLSDAREVGATMDRFTWIASDYWGTRRLPVKGVEDVARGAITISLKSTQSDGFRDYFTGLDPKSHSEINPWFEEFWDGYFNCKLAENKSTCPTNASLPKDLYIDDKVPFVIDAVRAFAVALDELYRNKCPEMTGLCAALTMHNNGEDLLRILKNVSFQGVSGEVRFDAHGDALGNYNVFRFDKTETGYDYVQVATWDGGLQLLDPTLKEEGHIVEEGGHIVEGEGHIVEGGGLLSNLTGSSSSCGMPCSVGLYRKLKQDRACCWTCERCGDDEYVKDLTSCGRCVSGETPDLTRTGCALLPLRYLDDSWAVVITCFAAFGIICVLCVAVVFFMFSETPLVKASGRELTTTLLVGLSLCYAEGVFLVLRPSVFVCGLQRFGVGFAPCVCYAALLIKTNRIARIFAKSERSTRPPDFINPASQLLILAAVVGVEVVLAGVGLGYWFPKPIRKYPTKDDILSTCNIRDYDLVVAMSYNVLLILLCTIYAFRTRKTPANFNEARYIGFAMYTTCVIWLAFLPVQIGVNDKDYKALTLSINVTLNATTLLLCVFGPKIYIVLLRPTRNIRSRSRLNTWKTSESDAQSTQASSKSGSKTSQAEEIGVDNLAVKVDYSSSTATSVDSNVLSTYL